MLLRCMLLSCVLMCGAIVLVAAEGESDSPASETPAVPSRRVVVYYFHGSFRCDACNTIESLAKAAVLGGTGTDQRDKTTIEVDAAHPTLTDDGRLSFVSLNKDDEKNKALFESLGVSAKVPVLVEIKDDAVAGKRELPDAWKVMDDKKEFVAFIQKELGAFIQKAFPDSTKTDPESGQQDGE